ncbi:S-layer homology domain-containing protein [Aminipila butyrica]|nr:S-layer homology domain-containing protein [Aminipila butyrica]
MKKRIKHVLLTALMVSVIFTGQPFFSYGETESTLEQSNVETAQAAEVSSETPDISNPEAPTEWIENKEPDGTLLPLESPKDSVSTTGAAISNSALSLEEADLEILDEPVTVAVKFYWSKVQLNYVEFCNEAGEVSGSLTPDLLKVPMGNFSLNLKPGIYAYKAYGSTEKDTLLGSGSFEVMEAGGQNIYLSRIAVKISKPATDPTIEDYLSGGDVMAQVKLGNDNYALLEEGDVTDNGNTETHSFVAAANINSAEVTCEVTPKDMRFDDVSGAGAAKYSALTTITATLMPCTKSISFQVTKGQPFGLYAKGNAHYKQFKEYTPANVDTTSNSNYDIYTYEKIRTGSIHYTAGGAGSGYLKSSGLLETGNWGNDKTPMWTVDLKKLNNEDRRDNGFYEANLYLNVDDSKQLKLSEGQSFDLDMFRTWQAVSGIMANYFIEPDFHFEILGDSVELTEKGGPGRLQQTITGVKKGISIIKVTYDAMEYDPDMSYEANEIKQGSVQYYNAIAPENIGIVIVNVAGDASANINTNINQSEYDTIYYTKSTREPEGTVLPGTDHAVYTFWPTAHEEMTVRVHDPLQSAEWGSGWTSYEISKDGSYTVNLKEGRNIIEIAAGDSLEYYVVNAKGLDIKIDNRTSPGEGLKVGETVGISFGGLSQPVQKMAGIYNPGFPNECWVEYETEAGRILKSGGVQYDLILYNTLSFVLTEAGELELVGGQIHASHLGSKLGAHRSIPLTGKYPNLNAGGGTNSPYFSTLPDIHLQVESNSQQEELSKLDYAQITTSKLGVSGTNERVLWYRAPNWAVLNQLRNLYSIYSSTNQKIDLTPTMPETFDGTLTAKYKQEGEDIWNSISLEPSGKVTTLFSSLNGNTSPVTYVEIAAAPKDSTKGYTQTYTLRLSGTSNTETYGKTPYITNIEVIPVHGKVDMELIDGQLHAIDQLGEDLGLGYGFLGTRNNYEVKVPYSVDQIKLKATAMIEDSIETGITINGESVGSGAESQVIALPEGEKTITVTGTIDDKTINYTLHVIRAGAPKTVSFNNWTEGAKIAVYTANGKSTKADEKGTYLLPVAKGYSYYYSKPGYLSVTKTFDVEDGTTAIELPELQIVTQTFGDVSVRVMAQDRILRDKTTISFTEDTLLETEHDLEVQGYVSHNYGGYTALHALIDAFDTGISKVGFTCYKGVLVPKVDLSKDGAGSNAGWVCEVNGKVCNPATTLVNNGDKVDFYYNPDYSADMQHAWFEDSDPVVTEGSTAEVILMATKVKNDGSAAAGVEGAAIKVNGTEVGTTDASGKVIISAETIKEPGQYTITAQKQEGGKNILTYAYTILTVKKADTEQPTDGKMTVKFRLIGDAKHANGTNGHGKYVTWIATKKMSFSAKSVSVYDVFTQALDQAGLEYVGAEKNYVRSITAPKAYGGYKLAEFTNGKNSGWMYTVNGFHPEFGLKDYYVTNGDSIVWHYVDDYIKETSFEGSRPEYPNRWLEAEDVDPPTDGSVIDMSKGNGGSLTEEKEKTSTITVSTEAKVDSNGKATASMDKKDITEAIKKVKEAARTAEKASNQEVAKKIVLEVKGTEKVNSLETIIPKESMKELNEGVDIVSVKSSIGEVRLDKASLGSLTADNGDVSISMGKKDASGIAALSEADKGQMKNRPAFEFSAAVGGKAIMDFAGKVIISIPYEKSSSEQEEALIMFEVKANGNLIPLLNSKYSAGQMTMQSNHLGTFIIGYNEAKFNDTTDHWAKSSITYLAAREIIKGKGANLFAPNSQITRSEFVQILANLSGADLSKYTGSDFKDVSEKAWYAAAVAWAAETGITGGTGNEKFSPDANITRQDMSVMIAKYVANVDKGTLGEKNAAIKFADNSQIAGYAKESVAAMQKAGIINGEKNNLGSYSFNPSNNATRAEASTMIANYIKQ